VRKWVFLAIGLVLAVGAPGAAAWAMMRPFDPDEFHWLLRLDLGIGLAAAAGGALLIAGAVEHAKRWRAVWVDDSFLIPPPRVDAERATVMVIAPAFLVGVLVSGLLVAFHTAQHLFGFSL